MKSSAAIRDQFIIEILRQKIFLRDHHLPDSGNYYLAHRMNSRSETKSSCGMIVSNELTDSDAMQTMRLAEEFFGKA